MKDKKMDDVKNEVVDKNFIIDSELNEGKNEDEILSRRPWKRSSVELEIPNPETGEIKNVWVSSIIDSNGNMVCYGNSADMDFIVDMENSLDEILKFVKSNIDGFGEFFDKFKRFSIEKKKAFIYN